MAHVSDELENNVFYKTLQTKYAERYIQAQKKNWIICVPCQSSLKGVSISQTFIDGHILKPSPYFKSHYVTSDTRENKTLEIEQGIIKLSDGKGEVKILLEETGYNDDYKPFRILVIEQPLNSYFQPQKSSKNVSSTSAEESSSIQQLDYLKFLQSFPEPLHLLDKKTNQFCNTYMVLPDYLQDTALKLQNVIDFANEAFLQSSKTQLSDDFNSKIAISIERYLFSKVHTKIYPVIRKAFADEDKEIADRLFSFYECGLTPDQLGVEQHFCCRTPNAVIELSSLNLKTSPSEKLMCLIKTLELLNQDIEKSLRDTYSPVNPNKDIPCLSSDDLIPLLVNLMVQARPSYLASNLYYVQNFNWHFSTKDKASFSLVTFQAAKEFLKSNSISLLKPSTDKIKKEMTFEELLKMSAEIKGNSGTPVSTSQPSARSTIDNQLEDVTKKMESSASNQ